MDKTVGGPEGTSQHNNYFKHKCHILKHTQAHGRHGTKAQGAQGAMHRALSFERGQCRAAQPRIFVGGGGGFIGSHIARRLKVT